MAKVNRIIITNPELIAHIIDHALDRIGAEVLRDAKLLAPRSPRQEPPLDPSQPVTGNLKNSIALESRTEGRTHIREVGTTVHYGVYQEFGTRSIPPRPFLGPALAKAARKWLR